MSEELTRKELERIFEEMEEKLPNMFKLMFDGKLNIMYLDDAYSWGLLTEEFAIKPEVSAFLKIWRTPEYYKIETGSAEEFQRLFEYLDVNNPDMIEILAEKYLGKSEAYARRIGVYGEFGTATPEAVKFAREWLKRKQSS